MLFRYAAYVGLILVAPAALSEAVEIKTILAGDLISLETGEEATPLRLYGIDAPEPDQPGAAAAKAFTTEQLAGKSVEMERLTEDSLGIAVVKITVAEEKDLSHLLVDAGLAWWDQENVPDDSKLMKLAAGAISEPRGIFVDALALAPWDWRKSHEGAAYTYSLSPKVEEPVVMAKEEEEEKPKELKLKGDGNYVTVPQDLNAMLQSYGVNEDINGILAQHGVSWATDANGNPVGLTADVASIPGAAQLGFQPGDILSSVNGMPITDMNQAMALAGSLYLGGQGKNANIKVIRNGRPVDMSFPIPKF